MGVGADTLRFKITFSGVVHLVIVGGSVDPQTLNEDLIDAGDLRRIVLAFRKAELFSSIILLLLLPQLFDKSCLSDLSQLIVVLSLESLYEVLEAGEKVTIEMISVNLLGVEELFHYFALRDLG